MDGSEGGRPDLPDAFPVFPLTGALLLPRGRLPLNIFEPRYLAMTEDALGAGRYIGMIQPDPRGQPGPTGPALYRVGCLGRITSFSETGDGRYLVTLHGVARFAVAEEIAMRRGYRRVRADFTGYYDDLLTVATPRFDRETLMEALRGYFERRGFEANYDAIAQMPDDILIVTLCMVCPFDPPEKQALLEADTTDARADALLALLRFDAHEPPTHRPLAS